MIFPLKDLGKHLALSLSKKYLDLHITDDDRSIPQRNIIEVRLKKSNKMVQKLRKPSDVVFISFHDKSLKKLILVNPYTGIYQKCLENGQAHIFPTALNKTRIHSMRNNHGKILLACDSFGIIKGILRCNHHDGGFNFVPADSIAKFKGKLVDYDKLKKRLEDIGLKENLRYKLFWQRWYKIIGLSKSIKKHALRFLHLITNSRRFHTLT